MIGLQDGRRLRCFYPLTTVSELMLWALCWKEISLNELTQTTLINLVMTCAITRNFRHGCLHFLNKLTVQIIMVP